MPTVHFRGRQNEFMTSFLKCRLFHDWSRWSLPSITYGSALHQWRVCNDCGKAQRRSLWWFDKSPVNHITTAIREVNEPIETKSLTKL